MVNKTTILIVLDGWGHRDEKEHNAIYEASTPFYDYLLENFPHSLIDASGGAVGLPDGQIGNSEVGHMTIGAGKTIDTDLVRISKSFRDNNFKNIESIKNLFQHVKENNSTLHVMGLVSPGGVHSHSYHLYEFLKVANNSGIKNVTIHAFTDGRDTPPQSGFEYLKDLENEIENIGIGKIATVTGRYYAMDRDKNWDRIEKAEKAIFDGVGKYKTDKSPSEFIKELYSQNLIDELLEPVVFETDNNGENIIRENDGIFFFNFRSDRAREISQKIVERTKGKKVYFVTMTEYDKELKLPTAFKTIDIKTTLSKEISKHNLTQVHIAETEKFAHATYFLNCGEEIPHRGEEFVLIESRKDVKTHDEAPEMKALEITDKAIEYIERGIDFIFINYANADIVGHTANKDAIIRAIEFLDIQLNKLITKLRQKNGVAFITADHGNAETNIDELGIKHTAHTNNLVPAIIVTDEKIHMLNGNLADIAPTVLDLMGLPKPLEMTGIDLIVRN